MRIMKHFENLVSRKTIYEGKVFNVHKDMVELENGTITTRDLVEHHGGVGVLAFTPAGKLIVVEQFRYGSGNIQLEIPAGKLEKGEDPAECGARELEEETGYIAGKMTLLTEMLPTPAYDSEKIYIYLAEDITSGTQNLDEDEFLTIKEVDFDQLVEKCIKGEISDAKTLVGVLLYNEKYRRGQINEQG